MGLTRYSKKFFMSVSIMFFVTALHRYFSICCVYYWKQIITISSDIFYKKSSFLEGFIQTQTWNVHLIAQTAKKHLDNILKHKKVFICKKNLYFIFISSWYQPIFCLPLATTRPVVCCSQPRVQNLQPRENFHQRYLFFVLCVLHSSCTTSDN